MRDTRDIAQLILTQSEGSMLMRSSKVLDKFRELLLMAIVKHDLPFQFVDYEGIRALFSYVCDDIKLITRNTVKSDVLNLYKN